MVKKEEKGEIPEQHVDAKDRKILRELFNDGRRPFSLIAKSVKLSKEAVMYRVRNLFASGLLVGFNTIIDVQKLGVEMFYVYISLRHIDVETEQHIMAYLKNHPNIAQIFRTLGNYDVVIKVFVRSYTDIDAIIKDIETHWEPYFEHYLIDYIAEETAVPFSFLYEEGMTTRIYYLKKQSHETYPLTETDIKIISVLAKNARMSLSELAERTNIARDTVKYHVRKLEDDKILLKYRPDIIPKLLGYNWYFLILKVGKLSPELTKTLEMYLLHHPNATYAYKTIGSNDILVELRVKTTVKLNEILLEIRSILKKVLKRHELLIIMDEPKYTYFPEMGKHLGKTEKAR